jgi:PmbA protein
MEKLLELGKKVADQVEVYSLDETADGISFENAKLKDIGSRSQSGISLRILKNGKLGFAYTKNLLSREELLQNALSSLQGGVEALFDLPSTMEVPPLSTYERSIEHLSNATLVEECKRVCELLTPKTPGQINLSTYRHISQIRLMNSHGTDLCLTSSRYSFETEILYPGSYSAIHRLLLRKSFERVTEDYVQFLLDFYNSSRNEVPLRAGKMKVLFLPETFYVLAWRLQSGANGRNVHQKISPLLGKVGEKLMDEKLTIYDDPMDDRRPGARGFDDEGIPCQVFNVIDRGIFTGFYYDLDYARKMNMAPTGHGYKGSMWGGETVSFKPSPALTHLHIKPGERKFHELLALMDKGVIVAGAMGAHSGNILNGEFSVGLSPGLYVENGEIRGHVKDAMVAGNIYETMQDVIEVEDTLHPSYGGTFPAILFDNVSIATKG